MLSINLLKLADKTPLAGLFYNLAERWFFLKRLSRGSFAQHGEDRFILDYFKGKPGFYIDVGANYPIKISNTYLLYRKGWSGITIEPIPRLHERHKRLRPKDIQLRMAVSDTSGELTFFELYPSCLSTFNEQKALEAVKETGAIIKSRVPVTITTLAKVIENYAPGQQIDLLSIDAEGFDYKVLQGVDWSKTRPRLIICEHIEPTGEADVCAFLQAKGYRLLRTMGCNDLYELQ